MDDDDEDVITELKPEHRHLLLDRRFMAEMTRTQMDGGDLDAYAMARLRECGLITASEDDIIEFAMQMAALPDLLLFSAFDELTMARFPKLKPEEVPAEVREAKNQRRRNTELARGEIEKNVEQITAKVIEQAKGGDMRAARLCLDKVIGPAKSEPGVRIAKIDDADPQRAADSVMEYLARGEINPEQAVNYLTAVEKRCDIRLLGQGLSISPEQWTRLMHLREMMRGRLYAPLVPSVSVGASLGGE